MTEGDCTDVPRSVSGLAFPQPPSSGARLSQAAPPRRAPHTAAAAGAPASRSGGASVIGLRSVASEALPAAKLSGSSYTSSGLVHTSNNGQGRTRARPAEAEGQTDRPRFALLSKRGKDSSTDRPGVCAVAGRSATVPARRCRLVSVGRHRSDGSVGGGGGLRRGAADRCSALGPRPRKTQSFPRCFVMFNVK